MISPALSAYAISCMLYGAFSFWLLNSALRQYRAKRKENNS